MIFSDLLFLYLLLPVSILVYYRMADIGRRNLTLLVISLLFFALEQPVYMPLMVALSYLNYRLALRIDPEDRSTAALPAAINIGVLFLVKYLDVLLDSVDLGFQGGLMAKLAELWAFLLGQMGLKIQPAQQTLPIGLSIYVLMVVSYFVDIYREKIRPEIRFADFLLYLLMFPKLLVGPLVRYGEISSQLRHRRHHPRDILEGLRRFLFGLAKKLLLADACGRLLLQLNAAGADNTLAGVWFGAVLFLFQFYYDFSGICDMAIGLGRVFGFRFRENVRTPYGAGSLGDFWKRWNVSLYAFFRDYVYLPLGGDKMGKAREAFNLLVMTLLMCLWYGAGWNFLLWGVFLFLILAVERFITSELETLPESLTYCIQILLLLIGWIIFSHGDMTQLQEAVRSALGFNGMGMTGLGSLIFRSLPLLLVCILGCTRLPGMVRNVLTGICALGPRAQETEQVTSMRIGYLLINLAAMAVLLWLCTMSLVGSAPLPPVLGL